MLGWLVVNEFIESKKFREIYAFLKNAAEGIGAVLEIKAAGELVCAVDDPFSGYGRPDFVLFWDKDIYLARRLESIGLRVFNSASAIEACDNKILTALRLEGHVKTPKTVIAPKTFEGIGYTSDAFIESAERILGSPFVLKEACGSFGQQVYLVESRERARGILASVGHKEILMQEFVKSSAGRDVRINVVGDRVVSAMMRHNEKDFRSNITNGGQMKDYTPDADMKIAAVKACAALGLDFAGVDVMFGESGEPIICEVNSNPHFKSSYDCTGIDMSIFIMEYIAEQLK